MSELLEQPSTGDNGPRWTPSKTEALKQYDINIQFLDRGVRVSVGCKVIAFEKLKDFKDTFNLYLDNPNEVQQSWQKMFSDQEKEK